jgi:hypothetical protein
MGRKVWVRTELCACLEARYRYRRILLLRNDVVALVRFLPSIVSTKTNQHHTNLWDGTFRLELHIGLHRNDHVAFDKGALIPETKMETEMNSMN